MIYTEAADKAARFILDCNQNRIPLIFLHDVNGFMVGKEAEWSGIIRAGAKMVNAVANSVVPKIAVICGGSFGAGHYAMCGKAYDPRFIFAWPTARYAVMSGDAAAGTLVEVKIKQLERQGKKLSDAEKKELYETTRKTYESQTDPRYAAARLWVDAIIDPARTRDALIEALDAAALNPDVAPFQNRRVANLNVKLMSIFKPSRGGGFVISTLLLCLPSLFAVFSSMQVASSGGVGTSALWFIFQVSEYVGVVGIMVGTVLTMIKATDRNHFEILCRLDGAFGGVVGFSSLVCFSYLPEPLVLNYGERSDHRGVPAGRLARIACR